MFAGKLLSTVAIIAFCSLTFLFSCNYASAVEDAPIKTKRIAVVEFNSYDAKLGKMLSEWTVSVLMERRDCTVIERILLSDVIEEQKLSVSGLVKKETTAKLGDLYGASHLLIGTLGKIGNRYLLTVKTIAVSSAETVESNRGSTNEIDNIPEILASLLNGKVKYQDASVQNEPEAKHAKKQPKANGIWEGFFQYDDPDRGYVKGNFTAYFKQNEDGNIEGEIIEPWSEGFPANFKEFHSSVENASFNDANNRIEFTKKYEFSGHTVDYRGTLVSSNVMTGRWNIGTYTGSWRAIRKSE